MNKPATLLDAVAVVRKSRLVPEDRLSACLETVRADAINDQNYIIGNGTPTTGKMPVTMPILTKA